MAKLENYSNKILFFIFQSELVSWLAEEMSQQGLDVDQLDIASNSPLHLAAKHGCTTSAAALLHFGTQVTLKVTYFKFYIKVRRVVEFLRHSCLKTNSDMSAKTRVAKDSMENHTHTRIEEKDGQTRVRQSVSA